MLDCGVIVEKFPELENLTPDAQLELAAELVVRAARRGGVSELSPNALAALETQLDHYLAHPETGVAWEDLRDQRK